MFRPARRDLIHVAALGLLAGLAAAASMVAVTLALRALLGLPLPVELANDRIVPTLSIGDFNRLARRLGGLVHGKEVAFRASLATQVILAVLGSAIFVFVTRWLERRQGERGRRIASLILAGLLLVVFALEMALLWPVLASNYKGLPSSPARWAAAAGLLGPLAVYWLVLVGMHRVLFRTAGSAPPGPGVDAGRAPPAAVSVRPITRRTLVAGAGTLAVGFAGAWLARGLAGRATFGTFGYDGLQTRGPDVDAITRNDQFYVVTKNLIDPAVSSGLWRLSVGGLVDRPRTYRFKELAALPSVDQPTTLECISNPVGGGLMSNAVWRGVPLHAVLEAAGPRPGATRAVFHAADGYVHTTSIEKAMDPATLLAYRMNGVPLPHRHGYPVRLVVPGTYGEVSVKWVDRIDLVDRAVEGYYEKQGWRAQFVNTTSRIDSPRRDQVVAARSVIPVAGVAFAGDRGVSQVEVSADAGITWQAARIGYAANPLTWALWTFEWQRPTPGQHELTVRATDGTGQLQDARDHGPAPSGATGYHRVRVRVGS